MFVYNFYTDVSNEDTKVGYTVTLNLEVVYCLAVVYKIIIIENLSIQNAWTFGHLQPSNPLGGYNYIF